MPISLPSNSQNVEMEIATSQSSDGSLSTSYQTLVLEAYGSIGEPDSMYGAGAGRLADVESRIRTYMHEHAWDKALGRKTGDIMLMVACGIDSFKMLNQKAALVSRLCY